MQASSNLSTSRSFCLSYFSKKRRISKKCANVKNPVLGRFHQTGVDWEHPRIPPSIRVVLYLYPFADANLTFSPRFAYHRSIEFTRIYVGVLVEGLEVTFPSLGRITRLSRSDDVVFSRKNIFRYPPYGPSASPFRAATSTRGRFELEKFSLH
jgi:hypothetical protein